MTKLTTILSGLALAATAANASVIVSLDSANQDGGDLNSAVDSGAFDYNQLKSQILGAGHSILPGIASVSAANLAGADVFLNGKSSRVYSGAELADLVAFIQAGGCAIVEVNSGSGHQATGNQILNALGLGNLFGAAAGPNSANGGTFANVITATTFGSAGDLRGLTFGESVHSVITPTGGTTVGTTSAGAIMVEFTGLGLGSVLAVGDPLGWDLFTTPAGGLYNANNANAYLNYIGACDDHHVPDAGSTAFLFAFSGLSLIGLRRLVRN